MLYPLKRLYHRLQALNHQFAVTQGERLVRGLERWIATHSLVDTAAFLDPHTFDWVAPLEAEWTTIRAELDTLLQEVEHLPNFQDISTDQASITQDDRWKTYFFYAYGHRADESCDRCPRTAALLDHIPGMKTAFFSILLPHKHIPEHRGPYKGVLRYHLALKVPDHRHQCGIRVGNETRTWTEGQSLLFDDTFPHEAWNRTDDSRVILFVDVVRPMGMPAAWLNHAMIQLISISPYVQEGRRNFMAWEQRFKARSR